MYRMILQQRKQQGKARQVTELVMIGGSEQGASDNDIKYKLHQCYVALAQSNQAINILQSIPSSSRSVKEQAQYLVMSDVQSQLSQRQQTKLKSEVLEHLVLNPGY